MTDAQRLAALDDRLVALEKANKLLVRDNKALSRDVKLLEERIAGLSSVNDPPTLKGWRFKNLPNGEQEITPIQ